MAKINVRQSQIAHTYATGSIGDFPGLSVMFLTHDHEENDWGKLEDPYNDNDTSIKRRIIKDKRLTDAFGIENFVLPPTEGFGGLGLYTVRFPKSMYCPSCGRIYFASDLESWKVGFVQNPASDQTYDATLRAYHCIDCQEVITNCTRARFIELVPTRFIIANEEGFIDDFPWDWYVHRKIENRDNRKKGHKLFFKFDSSSTSLASISIISKDKDGKHIASENLGSIFNQESTFISDGDDYLEYVENKMPKPWLGRNGDGFVMENINWLSREQIQRDEKGKIISKNINTLKRKYPRTLQRGANNLFFPLVFKGIRLPEGLKIVNPKLISDIQRIRKTYMDISEDSKNYTSNHWKDFFRSKRTNDVFKNFEDNIFELALNSLFNDIIDQEIVDKKQKLRFEEFKCYSDENIKESKELWYKARHIDVTNEYLKEVVKIDKITLLDKINELKIYRGFTRIRPLANEDLIFESDSEKLEGRRLEEYQRICDARKYPMKTNELPCAEVKGEGIFLKFSDKALKAWGEEEVSVKRKVW